METLKNLRKERQLKQKEVAQALNISVQSYCNYETGQRKPHPDMLKTLAQFYNVSVDYLLGRGDSPPPTIHIKEKANSSTVPDRIASLWNKLQEHEKDIVVNLMEGLTGESSQENKKEKYGGKL